MDKIDGKKKFMENKVNKIDGKKKFIVTLYSISCITLISFFSVYFIHDSLHQIEVLLVSIPSIAGIAGYQIFRQGGIDKIKSMGQKTE